jgi:hypothetical protein
MDLLLNVPYNPTMAGATQGGQDNTPGTPQGDCHDVLSRSRPVMD